MTLYVVRHADAGDRAAWTGDDRARPLSAHGRQQADALADLHADVPLDRVLSSPAKRCIDTVEPLAARRDVIVEEHDALAEGAPFDVVDRLLHRLTGSDALLCSHGDVIGAIVTSLRQRGSLNGRPTWRKASTWVIDGWPDPGRVELLPPPDVG